MKNKTVSTTTLLLATTMTTGAFGAIKPPLPLQVQTAGDVRFVSGGIGADERDRLIAIGRNDNLRLSFARPDGDFLGGAEVEIKNHRGKEILATSTDGPLLFAKLPAGEYTVEATTMGQTLTRSVTVPAQGQTPVYFTWAGAAQRQARK
jgi:hypothetical protein